MFEEKKKKRKWFGRLIITVILLIAIYGLGLVWFIQDLPRAPRDTTTSCVGGGPPPTTVSIGLVLPREKREKRGFMARKG